MAQKTIDAMNADVRDPGSKILAQATSKTHFCPNCKREYSCGMANCQKPYNSPCGHCVLSAGIAGV